MQTIFTAVNSAAPFLCPTGPYRALQGRIFFNKRAFDLIVKRCIAFEIILFFVFCLYSFVCLILFCNL